MQQTEIKIIKIGNSLGLRLPSRIIKRYQLSKSIILEERADELVIKPKLRPKDKLSWKDTFLAMAGEQEEWHDLDDLAGEALDDL